MYERSAIVLERYLSKIFGQDNDTSIKASYKIYQDILVEMEKYQVITEEEEKVIDEFDEIAKKMQSIQKKQEVLCSDSIEHEEERNKLFNDFDQDPSLIEKKLLKMEKALEENAKEQKELREQYIKLLNDFSEKQRERNKCGKNRRAVEANHIKLLNETIEKIEAINQAIVKKVKEFIAVDNDTLCQSLNKIMLENGKNEKIKFDVNVIKKAVSIRIEIAKKEAECYVNCYEKLKRLMTEIENDSLKLAKYQKILKDVTVKLNFLEAEKEYIVNFLDNERMTAINGEKAHKQMMQEACKNFDLDMAQINNLYNLILREIAGKSTKKAYKELYNSTYLANIEETEKTFNKEINSIRASIGTIINTNYWRIEGIKNLYEVFNNEVEEKFERDLSEFMPEENEKQSEETEPEELVENDDEVEEDDAEEWFISNSEINKNGKYNEHEADEYEDEEDNDEEDDEYEDDEYDDDENDEYDENEYNDEKEDEWDDKEDDEYGEDEWDDEEEDEYGEDEWDDEEDDEYDDDEYEEEYEYSDDGNENEEDEEDENYEIDENYKCNAQEDEKTQTKEKRGRINKSVTRNEPKTKKQHEITEKKEGLFEKLFKEKKK